MDEGRRAAAAEATRLWRQRLRDDPVRYAAFRDRQRAARQRNIEETRERDRLAKQRTRAADPDGAKAKAAAWRAANPDKLREYNQRQWEKVKADPALMEKAREAHRVSSMGPARLEEVRERKRLLASETRQRRRNGELPPLRDRRSRPRYLLDYRCYRAMRDMLLFGHMGRRTVHPSLPFDSLQLVAHIGALLGDLQWSGYGTVWNIDHKVAVSKFVYETDQEEGFASCWALANLQPMMIHLNRSKGPRVQAS